MQDGNLGQLDYVELPSLFIPPVVSYDSEKMDEQSRGLLEEVFFATGRVLHFERVMGEHPEILKSFYMTYTHLLWEPGPLMMQWRPFILAMGAAQHHCNYLVEIYEKEFIQGGGDPTWLKGLSNTPPKLQRLLPVTMLLARRPWALTPEMIKNLLQGGTEDEAGWSVGELAQVPYPPHPNPIVLDAGLSSPFLTMNLSGNRFSSDGSLFSQLCLGLWYSARDGFRKLTPAP